MARSEFVLSIGDDNAVLTRFVDGKVANAWLASADPAMALEELGEAFAQDTRARVSILFDTLDQSFKDEEVPKVSILDRRKVLARHINMAFPGANLRGARLVTQTDKKTLIYELASVPLDGRVPGWLDFVQSLPNEKGGIYTLAAENVDLIRELTPKDAAPPEEGGNYWRHLIGINATGGLRQIIEKNDRLSLTRLTQAPPADTSPADFGDIIIRDFKATITYIRRLGYQVGEVLDLVVLTTKEYKPVLEELTWDGARSVSVYTPYEAGALLGLGSLGREDQAYCDVLHAAWFASKPKGILPLSRAAFLGDTRDDIRELCFVAAPYAAAVMAASIVGWSAWTGYELYDYQERNGRLEEELNQLSSALADEQKKLGALPYEVAKVRNVIEVATALDAGKIDIVPILQRIASSLQNDAVLLDLEILNGSESAAAVGTAPRPAMLTVVLQTQLATVIATADEAVQVTRRLHQRLTTNFSPGHTVSLTREPIAAQAGATLAGGFGTTEAEAEDIGNAPERFYATFLIEKVAQ